MKFIKDVNYKHGYAQQANSQVVAAPQTEEKKIVETTSNALRDLPFCRNQPLISADDYKV